MKIKRRIPALLLPLTVLSLIFGTVTGWQRLSLPVLEQLPDSNHGAVMVSCFLGGLVMLERAVSLKNAWAFTGPVVCILSLFCFLTSHALAGWIGITLAASAYMIILIAEYFKSHESGLLITSLGGFCLLTGNAVLLFRELYPLSVHWWIGFLLFTILGQRLAISGNIKKRNTVNLTLVSLVFFSLFLPFHSYGAGIFGASMVLLALWLIFSENYSGEADRYRRYMNLGLRMAFGWLLVTGILFLSGGYYYDAQLHAFFIGFVFSMIFTHAPLMVQRVTRTGVNLYRPVHLFWLLLLQASLILRITGNISGMERLVQWGGLANGIVILLFLLTMVLLFFYERKQMIFSHD